MAEEIYLRRKIDDYLVQWKNNPDHMPLLVNGPRQIGKTESILHFARANYENVIYISFADGDYSNLVSRGYRVDDVLYMLTTHDMSLSFIPGKTIIIFDEVQIVPDIMTSMKSFKIDGRFDVICSGSLLGVHYKKVKLVSVGYQEGYTMKSMDFEEFLWALNYGKAVDIFYNHMLSLEPFEPTELKMYNQLFKTYTIVGGMPKAVASHVINKNLSGINKIHEDIIDFHKDDMTRYCEGLDSAKIKGAYESIPAQLARENKKFKWSEINVSARYKNYYGCLEWLNDAGLINRCFSLKKFDLPLRGYLDHDCYKVYLRDSGLLLAQLDSKAREDYLLRDNFGIYKGGLLENIVAEALEKSGEDLIYYRKENSTLEEEFILRTIDYIVPVEVKATNSTSASLRALIESDAYPLIKFGVKLTNNGNIGFSNNIYTFPLFCGFLVGKFLDDKYIH